MGAASLSAVPVVTAGFYSKDLILDMALSSGRAGPLWWALGLLGAFLTSLYAFRLVFLVFFGEEKQASLRVRFSRASWVPVGIFAGLAVVGGLIQLPRKWGGPALFSDFLQPALPTLQAQPGGFAGTIAPQILVALVSLAGIYVAYSLFARRPGAIRTLAMRPAFRKLDALALAGWGFDRFYQTAVAGPFLWLARAGRHDVIDSGFSLIAWATRSLSGLLSLTQTGRLRLYVAVASVGVLVLVAVGVLR